MDARHTERIETGVDFAAAAILAAACAYSVLRLEISPAVAGAIALAALLGGLRVLRFVRPAPPTFDLASFGTAPFPEVEQVDELVLTDADRLGPAEQRTAADELLLDDVVAKLEDLSRVVRLFDASAMPTPGELKSRIDRHLDSGPSFPDASQALHDALAGLRRTLR